MSELIRLCVANAYGHYGQTAEVEHVKRVIKFSDGPARVTDTVRRSKSYGRSSCVVEHSSGGH